MPTPDKNVVAGALLGFKVGTQESVDNILSAGSGAVHGCFYLTKDTHRLYVGNEDTSLSAVNEGIEFISTWDGLQAIAASASSSVSGAKYLTGRFYYVADRNVLCVYNGRSWVQLNENTNTTVESNEFAVTASNNTATVTGIVKDSTYQSGGHGSDGYFDGSFTVTGDNGITVTGSGTAITLTGDTYTLSAAANTNNANNIDIKLDSSNTSNDSSVTLVKGANVTLSKSASGNEITISSTDTVNTDLSIDALSTGGFTFTVTDTKDQVSDTVDPKIRYFISGDSSATTATSGATNTVSFISGIADLDVYSRSAIDSKLQAVNAMVYRGTVGSTGSGATSITKSGDTTTILKNGDPVAVSIGDTFLATASGTYGNISYQEGSLFIARSTDGTEQADGTIDPTKLVFDVVAERSNTDTLYSLVGITNGIELHDNNSGSPACGSLTINSGDNWIAIAQSGTDDKVLTITHQNVTRTNTTGTQVTQTAGSNITVPVITAVNSDAKGHITGIETTNYLIKDSNTELTSMATSTSAYTDTTNGYSAGVVNTTVNVTYGDSTADSRTSAAVFSSSSLTISDNDSRPTALNGNVTPGGLQIEMVWGSF